MVILIGGASHTGKTLLAQKLLEKYKFPYLSIDLLKMGLIRSKNTVLTPEDDEKLIDYLFPIVSEIIKTAIENKQNLVVEGCYIPFNWASYFTDYYLENIKCYFLIMTEKYISNHFEKIKKYENCIETRIETNYYTKELLINENKNNLKMCLQNNCNYILIDDKYEIERLIENIIL